MDINSVIAVRGQAVHSLSYKVSVITGLIIKYLAVDLLMCTSINDIKILRGG